VTAQENLTAIRDGYLAALAADSISPQPDYELNGKKVTRSAWRAGLLELAEKTNGMLIAMAPYRLSTVVRT